MSDILQKTSSAESGKKNVWKRKTDNRVFVNRSLNMGKIKFFGFDMDYTLAEYTGGEYEKLGFTLIVNRMIHMGYPAALRDNYEYDETFPIRGLWFDKLYGNLLKIDQFGNILSACHGFTFLKLAEIHELYPNKFILFDEKRIYVLNTLFNYPEIYCIACINDYFDKQPEYERQLTGVKTGDMFISFKSVLSDIRQAVDFVHMEGSLKKLTVEDMPRYLKKDNHLPVLLTRLRTRSKLFLLTNSDYGYTNAVMTYLLGQPDPSGKGTVDWCSFFDYVIVDANKPLFFTEGTVTRLVDRVTGSRSLGRHLGPMKTGQVYSGGSSDVFSELMGAKGKDVLYVGDHIFGDILKSKKLRGWRTFLIVPELAHELKIWNERRDLFDRLNHLDVQLGDMFKDLDSSSVVTPDTSALHASYRKVVREMDQAYGVLGSSFRSGSRATFFAYQVQKYSDIYAHSFGNMMHYPLSYFFKAPSILMPHESTVQHTGATLEFDNNRPSRTVPAPKYVTHSYDDVDDEFHETDSAQNSITKTGSRGTTRDVRDVFPMMKETVIDDTEVGEFADVKASHGPSTATFD